MSDLAATLGSRNAGGFDEEGSSAAEVESDVIAIRRIDELGFYNLSHGDLARKLELTPNKTTAAIAVLNLKDDLDCSKAFKIGRTVFQRYSQKAIEQIQALVDEHGLDEVWARYRALP